MAKHRVTVLGSVGKSILVDDTLSPRMTAAEAAILALQNSSSGATMRHSVLQGLQLGNDHPQYPLSRGRETIRGQWDFTKQIWASLGNAAAPGYAFTAAPDTGLFGSFTAGDPYFSSVVALLHFDGADGGTTFTDSSSYARAVTVTGGAITSTAHPKYGTATAKFPDSAGKATFADAAETRIATGDWTIEFWVYKSVNNADIQIKKNNFTSVYPMQFLLNGAGNINANGADGTGVGVYSLSGSPAPIATWQHVAITRNGSTFRLFQDGVLKSSATYAGTLGENIGGWTFGAASAGDVWIDDFRFTVGVARYTAAFTPPTAALPDSGDVVYESISVDGVEQVRVETTKATFYQTVVGVDTPNAFVAGVGTPGWPAAFLTRRKVTIHADYGFMDEAEFDLAGGVGGHASFATRNAITCAAGAGHANDFQARSLFTNPVAVTDVTGLWVQPEFNAGVATNVYGARLLDPLYSGAGGTITNNYGLWLGDMTRGATLNYSLWADGTSPSRFGGEVRFNRVGTGVPGTSAIKLDSSVCVAEWQVTTAAADGRRWLVFAAGSAFSMNAFNDAGTVSRSIFAITRTPGSPAIATIEFGNTTDNAPVTFHGTGALIVEGQVRTPVGTTSAASLRIPHGAAPSAPTNGDMWTTTAGLFVRINGVTVGPLT